jgi:transcriptional/translational regulatory protein YebC/TACO1
MFKEKGQILVDKEDCDKTADELMELALENSASDFNEEEDSYEILTEPNDFSTCREALEKAGINMVEADITMIPENYVSVTDEDAVYGLRKTLDLLDEDEDVKAYYTNWEEE